MTAPSDSVRVPSLNDLVRPSSKTAAITPIAPVTRLVAPSPVPYPAPLRNKPPQKKNPNDSEDSSPDAAVDAEAASKSEGPPPDLQLAQSTYTAPQPTTPETAAPATSEGSMPSAAPKTAESNSVFSVLNKPITEHTSSAVASWFGAAPTGAVLSGLVLAAMTLKSNGSSSSDTADTQAPSFSKADISEKTGKQLVLHYNETLSATLPAANAFQVMVDGVQATVSSVALSTDKTSVVLTLSTAVVSTSQQVLVSLNDGSAIKDLAGNVAGTFRNQTVAITDLTSPTLLSSQAISNADSSIVVLRFSETLKATTALALSSFQVSAGGVLQTISALEIAGDSIRLTLANKVASSITSVFLSYTPPTDTSKAVQDVAGNLADALGAAGGITAAHSLDSKAPTLSTSASAVAAVASSDNLVRVIRLSFDENLDPRFLPSAESFSITLGSGGSATSLAVSSLKLLGPVLELTLSTAVTDTQAGLRVGYTPSSAGPLLKDWAGNSVTSFDRSVATVDVVPPSMVSSRFTSNRTLELTFDESLASQGPNLDAWSLTANGGKVLKPTASTISDRLLTLTFDTAIQTGQSATLSYTAAQTTDRSAQNIALQDSLGNDSLSFTRTLDTTAPTLISAQTNTDGLQVLLNYNESLLSANSSGTPVIPAVSAASFVVFKTSTGERFTVNSVTISGTQAQLNLATAIKPTDIISVIYTAPTADIGVGNAALQDSAGNDAPSLGGGVTGQAVTNNARIAVSKVTLDSSTTALNQVVIQFNESISTTAALPATSDFTVKSGTTTQTVTGIARDPNDSTKLVLTLSKTIDPAGSLLLSYSAPSTNPLTGGSSKTLGGLTDFNFGQLITSADTTDTLTGAANRVDYFLGSLGNDTISGLGSTDHFVYRNYGSTGPSNFTQTFQDFGFKSGLGTLQGSAEADILDISQLLIGYTQATEASFLKAIKTADNKLQLQVDHDGGTVFTPTANWLFNNVTIDSSNQLLVNGQFIPNTVGTTTSNLTLANLVEHLRTAGQLVVL